MTSDASVTSISDPDTRTEADESTGLLEAALFEAKRVLVGQDLMIERLFVCWLAAATACSKARPAWPRRLPPRPWRRILGGTLRPPAVHARPRARRPRGHPHLPPVAGGVRHRARPGVRQRRARRRDQPGAGEGAVRAARGDGRAPRVDRRRHLRGARAVPRARDAEPHRERRRVPAARGAARPVPHEGPRRLPERREEAADRAPHERRPAAGPSCSTREQLRRAAGRGRRGVRPRRGARLRGAARARDPRAGRARPRGPRPAASPTAPAHAPRSASSPPDVRSPCCAGARYVLPQDVYDVARDVLRHRVLLSYEALADGVDAEEVVERIVAHGGGAPRHARPRTTPVAGGRVDDASGRRRARRRRGLRREADPAAARSRVTRKLDGLLHGDYQGLLPGPAPRRRDGRAYQPGDDVRRIDWNLTARSDRRTCATRSPTASSRPGSSSTAPRASTSAPPAARSGTWRSPPPPRSGSSRRAPATGSVR